MIVCLLYFHNGKLIIKTSKNQNIPTNVHHWQKRKLNYDNELPQRVLGPAYLYDRQHDEFAEHLLLDSQLLQQLNLLCVEAADLQWGAHGRHQHLPRAVRPVLHHRQLFRDRGGDTGEVAAQRG